jgi:hypothetical protein
MKFHWIVAGLFVAGFIPNICLAQTTQPTTASQPSAQQVASQLLSSVPTDKPLSAAPAGSHTDATSGSAAVAPAAPVVTVLREGSFIVNRVGRLTRSADGQQMEFTFDSDGKTMKDPPLVVLPNLKLMAMENAVTGSSRDLRFRISGTVTEYKGRNYILLDKVVVVPDLDQQF